MWVGAEKHFEHAGCPRGPGLDSPGSEQDVGQFRAVALNPGPL